MREAEDNSMSHLASEEPSVDRSPGLLSCSLRKKLMEEVHLVQADVEEMNGHWVVGRSLFQHSPGEEDHEDNVEAVHKE